VHTGTLHSANGNLPPWRRALLEAIGRIPAGVDTYCRSHAHLLTALEHWAHAATEIRDRVRLVLAGVIAASDRALVTRSSVASMVEFTGYCSHAETVRRQRTADLLFLPMHKMPPGSRATIVPGKTYEYLASDRPILAAIPAGDARDFLLRSGAGLVCEPDDVGQMRRILAAQYRRWADGQPHPGVDPDFLQQFERRELTRQLAGHLTALDPSLTGGSPSVPVGIYGPVR
jgi:glycosyltransferase involved in cell wall biosynthesis